MSHPLTGCLNAVQRVAWMRVMFGSWAHVSVFHIPQRLVVDFRQGVVRPAP